jgi:ABC-type multidrug transport system ATPase subunit
MLDNLGGDWLGLITIMIVHWAIFIKCENMSWNKVEQWAEGTWLSKHLVHKYPEPKSLGQLELDEDVVEEEQRVQKSTDHSVCVNKFRKIYSVPFSKPILAVERASFAVNEGECFALLGINGAGKSTTFKSLTNVVEPTSGKINILNANVSKDFGVIRYRIGYCP